MGRAAFRMKIRHASTGSTGITRTHPDDPSILDVSLKRLSVLRNGSDVLRLGNVGNYCDAHEYSRRRDEWAGWRSSLGLHDLFIGAA